MKRILFGVFLSVSLVSQASAQSFILDENDATVTGTWPNGSSQASVAYGGDYIHDNLSQDGTFVEWDLSGLVDSLKCYTVSAIWNANGSGTRATNVKYEIEHDGGTAESFQNQNLNTDTFNVLSTTGGQSAFQNPTKVRVFTGASPSSEQYIIADAIMVSETTCDTGGGDPVCNPGQGGLFIGKAYIPSSRYGNDSSTSTQRFFIAISNINSSDVDVSLRLYRTGGGLLTDNNSSSSGIITSAGTFSNYSENGGVTSFTLSAGETARLRIDPSGDEYGYGEIEWTSSGVPAGESALLAQAFVQIQASGIQARYGIPINSGFPF